ncbi:MAG TPA: ATP-binding protein [Streptomyces sp.]|nr:ATP-binding protein [Streptomyces sp.]
MSLPLTRRIAKTVLLTAAGAASVVGTAGAASAAELPSTADVGGLSNLDTPDLDTSVDGARSAAQGLTPKSSTSPLKKALPNTEKTVSDEANAATPRAVKLVDDTSEDVRTARKQTPNLPTERQGQDTALGNGLGQNLPVKLGNLGGLPVRV